MTEDAQRGEGEARAEEIEADVAEADARRAEEEHSDAEQAVAEAEATEQKLSRKERKAREKADSERREADEARAAADAEETVGAGAAAAAEPQAVTVGGDTLLSPGAGEDPEGWAAAAGTTSGRAASSGSHEPSSGTPSALDDQRPEVLIGAAFGAAFLFAKLLKRLGN